MHDHHSHGHTRTDPFPTSIEGLEEALDAPTSERRTLKVTAAGGSGDGVEFDATVRLDTPNEVRYFQHGGILHRVLRDLR